MTDPDCLATKPLIVDKKTQNLVQLGVIHNVRPIWPVLDRRRIVGGGVQPHWRIKELPLTSSQSSPGRRFVTLPMLSLPIALGLLGCTTQAEEPLELEDTVEITPLDDASLVPASEAGPAQHVAEPVL